MTGFGLNWSKHIGFGANRTLSVLDKLHLTHDLRFARIYSASGDHISLFERTGDDLTYAYASQIHWSESTALEFSGESPFDRYPAHAVLRLIDGETRHFDLVGYDAAEKALAGPVYRLVKTVTREGYETRITYSEHDITITDASGNAYVCVFDGQNRITSISIGSVNGGSRIWTYAYGSGTVTETDQQTGLKILVKLDSKARVIEERKTVGNRIFSSFVRSYDSNGHLVGEVINGVPITTETTLVDGIETTVTRLGSRAWTSVQNQYGILSQTGEHSHTFTRDRFFNTTSKADELGNTWSYGYDANGFRTREEDPDGVWTEYEYDDVYNMIAKTTPAGTWSYQYDDHNLLTREERPDGGVSVYVRYPWTADVNDVDQDGDTSEVHPWRGLVQYEIDSVDATRSRATYFEYNRLGQVARRAGPYFCDPANPGADMPAEAVVMTYDAWGNRLSVTDELGNATTYAYTPGNKLETVTDPLGNTTRFVYDGLGRKIEQQDAAGAVTKWHYDSRGYLVAVTGENRGGGSGCGSCAKASGASGEPGLYYYDDAGLLIEYIDMQAVIDVGFDPENFDPNDLSAFRSAPGTIHEYDAAGRKVATIDPRGDVAGANPNDFKTQYEYDAAGRLVRTIDPLGNAASMSYTPGGRLAAVTNAAGETTNYEYDVLGRQVAVIDPAGARRETSYDALGRVVAVADPLGRTTTYAYDLAGNQVAMTLPDGTSQAYVHDADGRVVVATEGAGSLTRTTLNIYDAAGRLVRSVADPDGLALMAAYVYDTAGRLVQTIQDPKDRDPATPGDESPDGLNLATAYAYDGVGRRTSVTDPSGRSVTTCYDGAGHVVCVQNGVTSERHVYDASGRRIMSMVSGRAPVKYFYDAAGNVIRTEQTDTQGTDDTADDVTIATSRALDAAGRVLASTDGEGKATTYAYDAAGRVSGVTNPEGETTQYVYDAAGRRTGVSFAGGSSRQYVYDAAGQLTRTSGGPEGTTTYAYDTMGRQIAVTDANGRVRETIYDSLGRVRRVENEMDQPVEYDYDIAGRRLSLTDAAGNTTVYVYDAASRLVRMTYPGGDRELYAYEGHLLATKTTANNVDITYSYDAAGNLASVSGPDVGASYARDAAGAVTADGVRSYEYDGFGRLVKAVDVATGTPLEYAYDKRGLRTAMVVGAAGSEAMSVTYGYDDAMRLTVVRSDKDAAPAQYVYDAAGRRVALVLPNGVRTDYAYDGSDRLQSLTTTDAQGATLASFAYTLDAVGNRTAIDMSLNGASSNIVYGFDDAYRLTSETRDDGFVQTFAYDAVGNRVRSEKRWTEPQGNDKNSKMKEFVEATTSVYNAKNQLVSSETVRDGGQPESRDEYHYDGNGNTLSKTSWKRGEGNTVTEMWYDALNRQLGWQKVRPDGELIDIETNVYAGAEWHRVSTAVDSGASTNYLYDGDNVVADLVAGTGGLEYAKLYVTPFLDQNLSMYDVSNPTSPSAYYYSQDGLGSVRTVTDALGVVKNSYDFTAFGEPYAPNTNVTVPQRYTYTGREASAVGAPMYYRYRMYDAGAGRFTARDPIGYVDGINIYSYSHNLPSVNTDPFGMGVARGHGEERTDNRKMEYDIIEDDDSSVTLQVGSCSLVGQGSIDIRYYRIVVEPELDEFAAPEKYELISHISGSIGANIVDGVGHARVDIRVAKLRGDDVRIRAVDIWLKEVKTEAPECENKECVKCVRTVRTTNIFRKTLPSEEACGRCCDTLGKGSAIAGAIRGAIGDYE